MHTAAEVDVDVRSRAAQVVEEEGHTLTVLDLQVDTKRGLEADSRHREERKDGASECGDVLRAARHGIPCQSVEVPQVLHATQEVVVVPWHAVGEDNRNPSPHLHHD